MSELKAALDALSAFPLVQAAFAILVGLAGLYMILRGIQDKKTPTNGNGATPAWTLYGPAHDAMRSIHDIAEQGRTTITILSQILTALSSVEKEQREQTLLMEDIRNNQVQRGDITPSPVRRKNL